MSLSDGYVSYTGTISQRVALGWLRSAASGASIQKFFLLATFSDVHAEWHGLLELAEHHGLGEVDELLNVTGQGWMIGNRLEILQAGHGRGDVDLGEDVAGGNSLSPATNESQLAKVMTGETRRSGPRPPSAPCRRLLSPCRSPLLFDDFAAAGGERDGGGMREQALWVGSLGSKYPNALSLPGMKE